MGYVTEEEFENIPVCRDLMYQNDEGEWNDTLEVFNGRLRNAIIACLRYKAIPKAKLSELQIGGWVLHLNAPDIKPTAYLSPRQLNPHVKVGGTYDISFIFVHMVNKFDPSFIYWPKGEEVIFDKKEQSKFIEEQAIRPITHTNLKDFVLDWNYERTKRKTLDKNRNYAINVLTNHMISTLAKEEKVDRTEYRTFVERYIDELIVADRFQHNTLPHEHYGIVISAWRKVKLWRNLI